MVDRPGTRHAISGNWATLLLPIDADDGIDFAGLAEEIDVLIAADVDGIYSNGTAGEFHNQTEVEFDAIQELLAERCRRAGMPFVVGACQPDPRLSLERVRRAATLAPAGIQVVLPDWWPVSEPEAVDFLVMAAEAAAGVPLILYNPPHAKRVLAPAELAAVLAQVPDVVGVKLGDGDVAWYAEARTHLSGIALYVPGHHLATGMREGVAAGAFSNVACLSPAGAQRWTRQMADDLAGALDVERRLQAFMDEHVVPFRRDGGYSNAALDKLLAAVGAWAPVGTRLRRPYRWIDRAEAERLRPIARAMLPEILGPS
ncbi:dihydrodipicolinate synthase family protein [Labrys wisconsinensis]|uniref:Dihydrodipicolinate synthase/N-acetylneuraminate lyase n=1 Tax=Labrys wisconsinensis TaxID=425677 RepID=A0ABU0JBK2_9HYPH|nr:dihydrodipicolinate synthase family protein [Labrys wisconsinensis]MDQ0471649.1 dihydrodipicolinate synthase/N-acetylneuraminate lyase [Labrys wisconsinensis]